MAPNLVPNLREESRRAAKGIASFADPVNGLDSVIPPSILRRAKGFVFMNVAKAGFVFSARAGSGVVIAKLPDGTWSAPSAVGTAGGGFGFQVGVEVAEFLIILNSRKAVKTFMSKGSITLGGNMSIAAGPLGRNVEGTGSLSAKGALAAMYSYSRSKGLFGGASVEGSIVVERSDANSKAYGYNVTATQLLSGAVDPPQWASPLLEVVERLSSPTSRIPGWIDDRDNRDADDPYARAPVDGDDSDDEYAAEDEEWRAAKARRKGRAGGQGSDGLTPDEYRERGYAFGSSYAAGGSSASPGGADFSPEKEKGRISSMLGSVGRSRSGSGGSGKGRFGLGGGGGGGGGGEEDPFAGNPSSSSFADGVRRGGPRVGGEARFETQFSGGLSSEDEQDIYGHGERYDRAAPAPRATREKEREGGGGGGGGGGPLASSFGFGSRDRDRDRDGGSGAGTPTSRSRSGSGTGGVGNGAFASSRAALGALTPSSRSRSGSGAGVGGGTGKLTKPRSGSGTSAGLRERAEQMNWGTARDREGFGSLGEGGEGSTDDEGQYGAREREHKGFSASQAPLPSPGGTSRFNLKSRFRSSSAATPPVTGFDPSSLNPSLSPALEKPKSRLRSSTAPSTKESPFDDSFNSSTASFSSSDGGSGNDSRPSLNRALSKPWDSEDESYFAAAPSASSPPPRHPTSSAFSPSSSAATGAMTPGGRHHLDLRQVEADFAGVLDLAKHGGEAEVGSYSGVAPGRSRSSTVTSGGGRSRSGTVTAGGGVGGKAGKEHWPQGVGKDGVGWAVALFDFPGVETTDLPFRRSDVLTILAKDDDEWWRARIGLREGMVPRNYLEAHFD
ncbi:hypothetical protein JCM8097_006729 [Rhodosporidiobolus ruineniae]